MTATTERPGTTAAARTTAGRDLLRSAAAPVICVLVLAGLLSAWVASGGAGTLTRVRLQITRAAVPMRGFTQRTATGPAPVYLTIRNLTGTPDELLAATSPVASRVVLTAPAGPAAQRTIAGSADRRTITSGLVIPAHGTVILSPFGEDVVLQDPSRYESLASVPLKLTFRHAGTITIAATVTAPGTP